MSGQLMKRTVMDWIIENKFDYITTNEPELLRERLKNKK